MTISSVNNSTYTAPLGNTATPVTKQSIGKDLLTALSLNQASQKSMLSSDLQDQVSLSGKSQSSSSPLTYDAKSLLQQLQNNMQRNNPMWQDDNSSNSSSSGLSSAVLNALNAKQNASSGTTGNQTSATTNSTSLADLLKQNPGTAKALIYSQNSQSMLSILG